MIQRRQLLIVMACTCCSGIGALRTAQAKSKSIEGGCGVQPKDVKLIEPKIVPVERLTPAAQSFSSAHSSSKLTPLDARAKAIARLSKTFNVDPPFGFYDDGRSPNAKAFRPTSDYPKSRVLFGLNLYAQSMQLDPSGGSVLGTLAHEYAHVALYLSGEFERVRAGRPSVKRIELHADYLCGYHLGLRKRDAPDISLLGAGRDIWESGDTGFNDPGHHGTPRERLRAAESGFELGFKRAPPFHEAFEAATKYIFDTYRSENI